MQLAHQPHRLLVVDDEGQVEVGGGLRHQVDGLLLERFEQRPEAVQDGADLPADERHRGARPEHPRAAELGELAGEPLQPPAVHRTGRGVERDGDVGLGGRHQVDGEPVTGDAREQLGEEADALPHAGGLERQQHHLRAAGDRLDARRGAAALRAHLGAQRVGRRGVAEEQRYAGPAQRPDGARVEAAGAGGQQLDRFFVGERAKQPRRRHHLRVGGEQARRGAPRLAAERRELRREAGGGAIGATFDEHRGARLAATVVIPMAARRAASGDHHRRPSCESLAKVGRRQLGEVGGEDVAIGVLVDASRNPVGADGRQQLAGIDGGCVEPHPPQPGGEQRHRQRHCHGADPRARPRPRLAE